jgi:hypothetical protein
MAACLPETASASTGDQSVPPLKSDQLIEPQGPLVEWELVEAEAGNQL